ncbi:MAG: hypothetical protein AAGA99_13355 [Actinomycetota bacterium]
MVDRGAPTDADPVERFLAERFRSVLAETPWLLVGNTDAIAAGMGGVLREMGASDVMAMGIGRVEDVDSAVPLISLGAETSGSMMELIRWEQRLVDDLPDWAVERLDEWDPERRARVMTPFTIHAGLIGGRSTWGSRPREHEALEDKLVAAEIWDAAGVERAPERIVALDDGPGLLAAHRELAGPQGTVWAGDDHPGWHGGASSVRWAADETTVVEIAADLSAAHRRVRIMPFLEGVPCSIHGLVIGAEVAVLRPCEMLVLLDRARGRFRYSAASTFWDPTPRVREQMRAAARAVGALLRDRHGYRGAFTIDGIATAGGFLPTELNARFGGALPMIGRARRSFPIFVVNCAVVAGALDHLDAAAYEAWMVSGADADRHGGARFFLDDRPGTEPEPEPISFVVGGDGAPGFATSDQDDEAIIATAQYVSSSASGVVDVSFGSGMPVGASSAPVAVQIAALLDERWGLGLGRLEPAMPAT